MQNLIGTYYLISPYHKNRKKLPFHVLYKSYDNDYRVKTVEYKGMKKHEIDTYYKEEAIQDLIKKGVIIKTSDDVETYFKKGGTLKANEIQLGTWLEFKSTKTKVKVWNVDSTLGKMQLQDIYGNKSNKWYSAENFKIIPKPIKELKEIKKTWAEIGSEFVYENGGNTSPKFNKALKASNPFAIRKKIAFAKENPEVFANPILVLMKDGGNTENKLIGFNYTIGGI